MLTLAIDTSTECGSIALGSETEVLVYTEFRGSMRHSSTLFPALEQFHLDRVIPDRLIVGLGPGSFSGIRVSLAAAHGLACRNEIPVFGICSAWSVARQLKDSPSLAVFADARRGEWYCTPFSCGRLSHPTYLIAQSKSREETLKYSKSVSAEPLEGIRDRAFPKASDYLSCDDQSDVVITGPLLEPIYLREPSRHPSPVTLTNFSTG